MSLPLLRWRTRSPLGGLAVALGATLAATAVRAAIGVYAPGVVPFAPFILAVLVAALVSGYAAGSIALTAGLGTAWYFFLEPAFSFALPSQNEVASLLLFAVVGVVEIIVAEALRRGFDRETARERRSARAQEFGGVGDWEWDILSGRVTWSENLYRLMGRDPASFQPSPDNLVSVVHPDDTDRVTKVLQDAMATGDRFEVEMRGILPDGTVRHFVSRGDVLKDHAGKPSRLMVVKIDITERRQADDALAESEKRYRQLFNAMSEAYVVHDLVYDEAGNAVDFRAFEANPAFESHTGLRRDIVVGRLASEFAPGGDVAWLQFFADVVRKGEPDRIERYSARPQRWIDLRAFPLGGPRFGIIFNDVTKRKLAEAEREAAEARLAAAMQVARVGAFDYDPATGMVAPSRVCDAIYGFTEPAKERPLSDYLPRIHPNDLAGFEAEIERALHEHDAFRLDYRIRTDDGSTRWVTSRGAVIGDSKGGSRLVGAIFDITARKQAELEAAAARERTEILFREMNHRTKNNLTIVASMLHLQASAVKQDAEIRRHLDAARERITTIAELHTSLYQGTTLGEIDFADYIRNLCAHIQTSLLSGDRGITFVVKTDTVSLSADIAVPLGLVVNELATNAVKHAFVGQTNTPQIEVAVRLLHGNLVVCVKDNGRGLPEGGSSRRVGLGSRLIEAFVAQVGGRITVSRGGGTQFEIVVPKSVNRTENGTAEISAEDGTVPMGEPHVAN